MNVWIVNPYGEMPSEGWREYRSFMLAQALAARGHTVTWWISDFVHRSKSYRSPHAYADPLLPSGVRVLGIHSTPYRRNISWARVRYESEYGQEVARRCRKEPPPDVIVLSDPALFFSAPILAFRRLVGCRLVLDVLDLWPELFAVALPRPVRWLDRVIFYPLYRRKRRLIAACDGVVAVSRDYLCSAMRDHAGVPSLVSYLGIDVAKIDATPVNLILDRELQQFCGGGRLTAVYAGTLGDAYDTDIIEGAIRGCEKNGWPVCFVVAGEGPRRRRFEELAALFPARVKFLGPRPASDMKTLYARADVGLMTYVAGSTVSMPVKFFDYLAGGLAVLNSLSREVRTAIDQHGVGLNYRPSDLPDLMSRLQYFTTHRGTLDACKVAARNLARAYDSRVQHSAFAAFVEGLCATK